MFGFHDYEQYYKDLWRKSFVQTRKLAKMISRKNIIKKWKKKLKVDKDYRVILAAHRAGIRYNGHMIIDRDQNYGAESSIKLLKLKEKGEIK